MISSELLINFLNKSGIVCESIETLDGSQIPREVLLDESRYVEARTFIPELKRVFSSSNMTSLQSSAESNQRWPLLNIVRQVLRYSNYRLIPRRLSDGYTPAGKKKYRRIFEIQKLQTTDNISVSEEE